MIGDKILSKLKEKGMTQKRLAESIGVSTWTVSMWVNNKVIPNDEKLSYIAKELDCNVEYLKGIEKVSDRELKRNGSGYYDPTAYKALKRIEREEDNMFDMVVNRGDIFTAEMTNGSEKKVLVVSCNERNGGNFVSTLMLKEDSNNYYAVPIVCGTLMYVDCDLVAYNKKMYLKEFVKTATEEEMRAVDCQMRRALGLGKIQTSTNEEEIRILDAKVIDYERIIEVLNKEIDELCRKNKELSSKQPDSTAECLKLETERDLYKRLYEQAFERLIAG